MAFEYNGFIHRDLEPQVRYDAEQIQLLKQADVAINENLQTISENFQTQISNKLTKPTNPSAESAVTMLADGTVGTKPLSEIGGGGKLYRHSVTMVHQTVGTLTFTGVSCIKDSFVANNFSNFPNFVVLFNGYTNMHGSKTVKKITKYEQYTDKGRGIMIEYEDNTSRYEEFAGFNVNVQDSITEE